MDTAVSVKQTVSTLSHWVCMDFTISIPATQSPATYPGSMDFNSLIAWVLSSELLSTNVALELLVMMEIPVPVFRLRT